MRDRLTAAQIRGARGMLNWSMMELAKRARVSISTVKRVEHEDRQPVSDAAREMMRGALEAAGMMFSDGEGAWIGLQLQPHRAAHADGSAEATHAAI